jgi:hypothetical protein
MARIVPNYSAFGKRNNSSILTDPPLLNIRAGLVIGFMKQDIIELRPSAHKLNPFS